MQLNTITRYPHVAALNKVYYTIDPSTKIAIPSWNIIGGDIACKFITPTGGNLRMYSKALLKSFDRLLSPKDAGGNLLFKDDVNTVGFQITTVSPMLNPLGFIDGYAYGIKRVIKEVTDPGYDQS